jgi:hypothetical protein
MRHQIIFVAFVNYLLKGKAADIEHSAYPAQALKRYSE